MAGGSLSILSADAGVGKSVFSTQLGSRLPDGSVLLVYDCFGNGAYRSASGYSARTIHSVKGQEFAAVCVVMSPATAKGIVDFLTGTIPETDNEEARKVYVGASRAERLLAIALPRTQAVRLRDLIAGFDAAVTVVPV